MSALTVSLIICALLVGGALVGALLRHLLPDHHLDVHAKDIVRLGCALVATISGLVLGLLINSAKTAYDNQRDEIRQIASICLFSPLNPTAFGAIVLIALSASGAIFLILEMYRPFTGLMQIDSMPLRQALAPL